MPGKYNAGMMLCLLLWSAVYGQSQTGARAGSIHGRMKDGETGSPLAGGHVMVINTVLGTVTGEDGRFEIDHVPAGGYSVRMSYVGYAPVTVTDVVVKNARIAFVDGSLKPSAIQGQPVKVTAGYFTAEEALASSTTRFSYEEIRRAPGSGGDVSRILTMLPSVAKVNDQSNSLIVRGGHPSENGFFIDGFEVPNINHFPDQASTGGPIGMIHIDLVKDAVFHTGGFSAAYGDRLSSVIDIGLREGNREETDLQLDLNFAGFGGAAEGPLAGGRGSWLVSLRRSYLDLVVKAFDVGSTVAPRYGDAQVKAVLDAGKNHTLSLIGFFGDDHNAPDREAGEKNDMQYYGNQDDGSGTVGISWRAVWNGNGYSLTTLSHTRSTFFQDWYETNTGSFMVRNRSREGAVSIRNLNFIRFSPAVRMEFGFEAKRLDCRYDNRYGGTTNALGDTVPPFALHAEISGTQAGAFAEAVLKPHPRGTLQAGLRADWFSVTGTRSISPRLSASWALNDKTSLKAAAGFFYQHLPMLILARCAGSSELNDIKARHAVLGVERLLTENTRLTLEAYHKDYDGMPLDPGQPQLSVFDDKADAVPERLVGGGRAASYGIELTVQKKLAQKAYGLASAAWTRSRYRGLDGIWRNRNYDNRFAFSAEGGYRPNRNWEFSMRWVIAGGTPYTPMDPEACMRLHRMVLDAEEINGSRYPAYHSMNVRFDRRFHFRSTNLIFYLSAWNVYNRKNVAQYFWNDKEQKKDVIYQWLLLPLFGLEYEM
jgi:hypothetical protein